MKALRNTFVLLLASAGLASCGGGGTGSHSALTPPGTDTSLQLVATTTTLPASPFTVGQEQDPNTNCEGNFPGSPYIAEVDVTWRHSNGDLVTGTSTVNVATSPVTIISFSTLDSPNGGSSSTNPCADQFHTLLGSGPVDVTAGTGTIFVHAGQTPGTGVVTVTAVDPVSGQNISAQIAITVVGASIGVPASITATAASGVYISGSGGPQSTVVTAVVSDGSGAFVPTIDGVDNVQFDIVGPAGSDARLVSTTASGQQDTGTSVVAQTHNGVATVTFESGAQQGPVQVRATADRGDNNVDNGISDPVSATTTVVVSDGKLYSLTLTSPDVNAILANDVSGDASLSSQNGTTITIPPAPNAIYSLTVTAAGTDREGNPVLPGTSIRFGEIDAPQGEPGSGEEGVFLISGVHGNPQEGGTLFTATDGHFLTAGGGANPSDTLVVFGKTKHGAPPGNDLLESASKITNVISEQELQVATPFNFNYSGGNKVDTGAVLPYIVGFAEIGNITSPAFTDAHGDATTTLNYPVSALGRSLVIYAQGNGTDTISGGTTVVTDAEVTAFPGIAAAQITISPDPIPGNESVTVVACIVDALLSPIANVHFEFSFNNLGVGSGTLDGISGAGVVPDPTDASGCVATSVSTTGIAASSSGSGTNTPNLTFTAGTASQSADITAGGGLILLVKPSVLGGDGGNVTLTLLNSNGTPVPGVQLVGTCTNAGITQGPCTTNSQGQTTATITANLNEFGTAGTGSCTFTTSTGSPTATVNLQGIDLCSLGTSPPPSQCTGTTTTPSTVTLSVVSGAADTASFTSSPPGASCSGVMGTTQTCTASLNGGTYTLTAVPTGATPTAVTWSGSCTPSGTNKATLIVPTAATTGLTCTATEP